MLKVFSVALTSAIMLSAASVGSIAAQAKAEEIEWIQSRQIDIKVGTADEYVRMIKELTNDPEEIRKASNAAKNYTPVADNSNDGYLPEVLCQNPIGSCGAWSGVYYTYTHEMNYHLKRKTTTETTFNPLFIYNLNAAGFNNYHGIFPYKAFDYIGIGGCITRATNPDMNKDYTTWNPTYEVWREANNYRLSNYFWFEDIGRSWNLITSPTDPDLDAIKTMLRSGHVTSFCAPIYDFVYDKLKAVSDPKYPDANKGVVGEQVITTRKGPEGYHAMTIVGYNDNIWTDINKNGKIDDGEMGAFKLVNSWDKSYGNKGFCWIAYDALNKVSCVKGAPAQSGRDALIDQICMPVFSKDLKSSNIYLKYTLNCSDRLDAYLIISAKNKTTGTTYKRKSLPAAVNNSQQRTNKLNYAGTTGYGDGTFIIDLDNIVPDLDSNNFNDYIWSVEFVDGDDSSILTVKEAVIIDENTGKRYNFNITLPLAVNNTRKTVQMMPVYNINHLGYTPKSNVVVNKPVKIAFITENEVRYSNPLKYQINITKDGKNVYSKLVNASKYDAASKSATVVHSWTPTATGTYNVTVSAVDASGATAQRSTTIKVFSEKLVFRSITIDSNNKIGGSFLFNYETIKITPKVTGGKGDFTYSYYYKKGGKTYKILENTKKTSVSKAFTANCGTYTIVVKAKDSTGKTVSMSKNVVVSRSQIRGINFSKMNINANETVSMGAMRCNMSDKVTKGATYRYTVTDPKGSSKVISESNSFGTQWTPTTNGVHKVKCELIYNGMVLSSCTNEYTVGKSDQGEDFGDYDSANYYLVKVNVINYICNEYKNNSTNFKLHYWNNNNYVGDAAVTATGKTVSKNVGFWSSAQNFVQYTVLVPKKATGFKFHIGDRWFGADGNLSTSNSVYIFNYSGDKATYCKE